MASVPRALRTRRSRRLFAVHVVVVVVVYSCTCFVACASRVLRVRFLLFPAVCVPIDTRTRTHTRQRVRAYRWFRECVVAAPNHVNTRARDS